MDSAFSLNKDDNEKIKMNKISSALGKIFTSGSGKSALRFFLLPMVMLAFLLN